MEYFIKKIKKELNIDIIGSCNPYLEVSYFNRINKIFELNKNCEFVKKDFLDNKKYELYLKNTNGVIVIGLAYHLNDIILKDNQTTFSSSSWGIDYHKVLKLKIEEVIKLLKLEYPNEDFVGLVDSHSLDERYYAYKSGVGFYGKNGLIINAKYGSNIFLGLILTTVKLKDSFVDDIPCLSCMKCVKVCPANCICDDGIDYNKCVSYLTQKKQLTKDEEKKISILAYGCDICSTICPYNHLKKGLSCFSIDDKIIFDIDKEFNYSNKEFKNIYGTYSASWRGKNIIKRNLELIRKNREDDGK